jgi:HlyD family secretion protein
MGTFGKDEGTKVTAEKVQKRTITEIVNASGKIYPEIEVKVSPDISGEITELNVQEGDTVKKGQVLARIYADIYDIQRNQAASGVAQSQAQVNNSQAALDALKANMEQAEKTFNMQKQLFADKVISQNEYNVADASFKTAKANYNAAVQGIKGGEASVQTARASLQRAQKDLGRTIIVAPSDGVISLLSVKKGEKVAGNSFNVGTEMMRIADMNKIEVRVDVGENDIPKVKLGDSAVVNVDAYNNRKFKGIVTQIASSNNGAASQSALANTSNDVTQYKVYIRLLPESYMDLMGKGSFPFRPGMSANADIQTQTHTNILSVPINAVTTREKSDSTKTEKKKTTTDAVSTAPASLDDLEVVVFIRKADNTVKKVVVKTDIQDINNIEITQGLKEGDEVITGPYDVVSKTLKEGTRIKLVDKKDLFDK